MAGQNEQQHRAEQIAFFRSIPTAQRQRTVRHPAIEQPGRQSCPRSLNDPQTGVAHPTGDQRCSALAPSSRQIPPKKPEREINQLPDLGLREISTQVEPGAHAVLVVDRTGWHRTGGKLKIPDNISLLYLPPYSPELNPVENIRQYLRQNYLSNRVYESCRAIVDACCEA